MKVSSANSIEFSALSRRILAVLADLAMAYILFYGLLSFDVYTEKFDSLSLYLMGLFDLKNQVQGNILAQSLGTLVFVYGLYIVIRFYSSLALGVSLSQWLLGLRGVGNPLWKRIGGGARVIIELILGPLLFGDLFLLFGKPSLKESLSHTHIEGSKSRKRLYAACVWVPALLIFSTISPLFQGLTLMDGIILAPVKENLNLKGQGDFKKFNDYQSNRFKFRAFSSLNNGRFLFFPSFEIIKEGSSKKIKPFLWLYDHKLKRDAFIKIEERFSLLSLLEKAKLGNPLFESKFPNLTKVLKEQREVYLKKKYQNNYEAEKLIPEAARAEIETLVRTSLELGSGNIVKHLFEHGPFFRGFVAVKNRFVERSLKGVSPEVEMGKIGSHSFLRFKQLFDEEVFEKKRMVETYVPIETNNSLTLRFYWGEDMQSALSRKTFRESFLQSIVWYFDYFNIFPFPEKESEIGPLSLLDHFTKTDLKKSERALLEEGSFRMYFKLCRRSLQNNDEKLQEILIESLGRLKLVTNLINNSKEDYYSKKFLIHLRDLNYSLKNKDNNYFGLAN